jgi:hypothetical protein
MQKNTTGWLSSAQFDGVTVIPPEGSISPVVGKIVLAYATAGQSDTDKSLSGPYVVEDAGGSWVWTLDIPTSTYYWFYVATYARMRRAPGYDAAADFIQNMVFQAQTGNDFGTGFFSLDTAQPITLGVTPLNWTFTPGPTYPWVLTKELLTGSQLITEGVSNVTLAASLYLSGDGTAAFDGFPSLIGTPGLGSLPAGPWTVDIEAAWIGTPSTGAYLNFRMVRDTGVMAIDLFTTPSIAITTTPTHYTLTYNAPSFVWAPTDRLVFIPQFTHTAGSGVGITMNFYYNSAARGTKITVPFEMSVSGSSDGDHRHLSHRDDPHQHPATAVDTGTTNFNKNLSTADTTVQEALDTLDNLTVDHAKYLDTVTGNVAIGTAYQPVQPGEALVTTGTGTAADWTFVVTAASIMAASTTVASGVVPISDGSGTLNSWVTHASGDLSSNTAITASGSVYKIVQYDTKGLVLVGADANPANIGAVAGSGTISGTTNYLPKKTATGWGDSRISDNVSSGTVTIEGGTAPAGYPPLLKLIGTSYLGIDLTGATGGYALAIANNQFITMANTLGAPISLLGVSRDNITYLGANSGNSIRIATPLGYGNSDGITVQGTTNFVGIGKSPSELLDVAGTVGVLSLKLNGSGSGVVTHGVAATTASYTMLAPSTAPATGQVIAYPSGGGQGTWVTPTVLPTNAIGWLYNNGSGVLSWSASTIASSIATSTTNVSIGTTAPTGSGQAIVTTSTTAATWQTLLLPSRQILTTNGLQGGGDLTADRTLSPVYGTAVNTVAQGNDFRFGVAGVLTTATGIVTISAAAQPGSTGMSLVTTGTGTTATWQTVATLTSSTPAAEVYGGSGVVGTGTTAARWDHVHALGNISSSQVTTALGYTPLSGTGTSGTLAVFTGTSSVGNSLISESGSTVVVNGSFNPSTANIYTLGSTAKPWLQVNTETLNLDGVAATAVGRSPNALVVSDSSGTLNSWITGRVVLSGVIQMTSGMIVNPDSAWHDIVSTTLTPTAGQYISLDASVNMICSVTNTGYALALWISVNGGAYVVYGVPDWGMIDTFYGGAYRSTGKTHATMAVTSSLSTTIIVRAFALNNSIQVPSGAGSAEIKILLTQ